MFNIDPKAREYLLKRHQHPIPKVPASEQSNLYVFYVLNHLYA
jgi:hypothetical protein